MNACINMSTTIYHINPHILRKNKYNIYYLLVMNLDAVECGASECNMHVYD